ncbi:SMP-30/gluconolactonase/LRE family protein [Phenylobacterium sp.]|uniref:SMP-30/gluconolactonase/LRE family protein n=1 Tax=Phenylobacterium sp. TaxID=1871053 RepID=UPI002600089F|nr:SMP-30/gluconolactonase/LRE family protein [Phenylobacterium sp.]
MRISIIGRQRCGLGESPLWDPDAQVLYWVDSVAPAIWRLDPATGEQAAFPAPDRIGSVVLGSGTDLIAGLTDGIYRVDLTAGTFEPLVRPDDMTGGERLNDGKTDRAGRLVTGTIMPAGEPPHAGKLYRFDPGGGWAVLETGVEVSNAICFSPAGDRLYFADSLRRMVWSYDYDAASGAATNRRDLIDTGALGATPDGATVDADGFVWVALVLTRQIGRFSPEGHLDRLIDTPCPYPSCPAFGGRDLDVLYVTSIADSGGRLKSDHPDAGRLMAIEGLGVRGLAETRCRL